jgi:hypothetical protein
MIKLDEDGKLTHIYKTLEILPKEHFPNQRYIFKGEVKTPKEKVINPCNIPKKYKFEDLEDLPGTILMPDEDGDLIELDGKGIEKHIEYLKDLKDDDFYVRVRSHDGIITEVYKTLDGTTYDWHPITEEDFE